MPDRQRAMEPADWNAMAGGRSLLSRIILAGYSPRFSISGIRSHLRVDAGEEVMCGIVGIVGKSPVNQALYDTLLVLQHRGQDAAGIVTCQGDKLHLRKDNGLARDVFRTRHMIQLGGNMGVGHVRYPTAGAASSAEAQPFYVNSPYGIVLAHNGNLTNAEDLKRDLFVEDLRHLNTESDSEILLNVFAHELQLQGKLRIDEQDIFRASRACTGAAVAVMPRSR
jgi:amidophosphoribosyltransferase